MNEQLKLFKTLLKNDLSFFTQKVFTTVDPRVDYLHNWHVDLIAEYLLACKNGEIKRLIINIPPRHLKSISVAVAFPAWLLGHNPSEQIMCASYSEELSYQHSMNCRLLLESPWYHEVFPETKLAHDQNTKRKFITTRRGHRIAASVGGTATGEGGNFLIVDDPISAEQALSEVYRERAKRWFFQTFSTRLNDKKNGAMIVIMQRLHEDDLTGHLLRSGGWEHLCLPLIAEEDETLEMGKINIKRKEGDLLHSSRIGPTEVEQIKSDLKHNFIGQYQQRPSPEGGGEFFKEWLMYYEKIDHKNFNNYIVVDPANEKKEKSDYTSAIVFGAGPDGNLYLVDAIRDKLNVREREDLIFDWHQKYEPKLVVYEKYGMQVDIDWIRKAMEDRNYRFRIQEVGGILRKKDRIDRLKKLFSDRKIYLPKVLYKSNYECKTIDVIDEFIHQEYVTFPVGLHDDMLDAMSRIVDISKEIIYPGKGNIDYYTIYNHHY
jgi:predicted phage terminase large subunit-like protein